MAPVVLVDSDIVIAHLRGVQAAREWLIHVRTDAGPLGVSVISITEVAGGMRSGERRDVIRLLSTLIAYPVTKEITWRAAELRRAYRRSHPGIAVSDYLIAATAQVESLERATLNVRHFPMMTGLTSPFRL